VKRWNGATRPHRRGPAERRGRLNISTHFEAARLRLRNLTMQRPRGKRTLGKSTPTPVGTATVEGAKMALRIGSQQENTTNERREDKQRERHHHHLAPQHDRIKTLRALTSDVTTKLTPKTNTKD